MKCPRLQDLQHYLRRALEVQSQDLVIRGVVQARYNAAAREIRIIKWDLRRLKRSTQFVRLDRPIHGPARLLTITTLYPVAAMDVVKLQKSLTYTQGNLSSHLAKLQAAGYLALENKFKRKYPVTVCSLTKKGREASTDYAEKLKAVTEATSNLLPNKA